MVLTPVSWIVASAVRISLAVHLALSAAMTSLGVVAVMATSVADGPAVPEAPSVV